MRRNWPREGRQLRRRIWPPSRGPNPTQFRARNLPREGRKPVPPGAGDASSVGFL